MSERGVFAVDRGIWDHPTFKAEPFTEREAWMWLLSEAEWKPRKRNRSGATISLERGQLAHSIRFMAEAWQWHRARVERFLARLKTETMIETRAETVATVITICKYSEYQRVSLPNETPSGYSNETVARQSRDKPEDRENIQDDIAIPTTRAEIVDFENELRDACGPALHEPSAELLNMSAPLSWLANGCDRQRDIFPTLRAVSARQSPGRIKGWAFFTQAVFDARATRLAPPPRGQPSERVRGSAAMDAWDRIIDESAYEDAA